MSYQNDSDSEIAGAGPGSDGLRAAAVEQPGVSDTLSVGELDAFSPQITGYDPTDAELDALMEQLRGIAGQVDAPLRIVDELARAAFETRDLDAEFAALTADSEVDELQLVRSVAVEPRMVSFETDAVSIDLQLDQVGETLTVRGLVVGAAGEVLLDTGDRRISARLDDRGWFVVEGVPTGALRLRARSANGTSVTTEWIAT